MIRLLIIFILGAAALALGPILVGMQGEIFIRIAGFEIYTTVTAFVIVLLGVLLIYWFITRLVGWLFRRTRGSFSWFGKRKKRFAREQTQLALVKFLEGDYKAAENALIKGVAHADMPALNFLLAAELAQKQGDFKKSQHYISLATEGDINNDLVLNIMEIRLLVEKNDLSAATMRIEKLLAQASHSTHPEVLRLATQIYQRTHAYSAIIPLLPWLAKKRVFTPEQVTATMIDAYRGLMLRLGSEEGIDSLINWWEKQTRAIKNESNCQILLVETLITMKEHQHANAYFDKFVKQNPTIELFRLVHRMNDLDWHKLQKQLNSMAKKFNDKVSTDRILAIIAMKLGDYQRAEELLTEIIRTNPSEIDYDLQTQCLKLQNKMVEIHKPH